MRITWKQTAMDKVVVDSNFVRSHLLGQDPYHSPGQRLLKGDAYDWILRYLTHCTSSRERGLEEAGKHPANPIGSMT